MAEFRNCNSLFAQDASLGSQESQDPRPTARFADDRTQGSPRHELHVAADEAIQSVHNQAEAQNQHQHQGELNLPDSIGTISANAVRNSSSGIAISHYLSPYVSDQRDQWLVSSRVRANAKCGNSSSPYISPFSNPSDHITTERPALHDVPGEIRRPLPVQQGTQQAVSFARRGLGQPNPVVAETSQQPLPTGAFSPLQSSMVGKKSGKALLREEGTKHDFLFCFPRAEASHYLPDH